MQLWNCRDWGRTHISALRAPSFPTLCDPMDCSPPGSSVHGILQARVLEWVAVLLCRGPSRPTDRTCLSYVGRWILLPLSCLETTAFLLYCTLLLACFLDHCSKTITDILPSKQLHGKNGVCLNCSDPSKYSAEPYLPALLFFIDLCSCVFQDCWLRAGLEVQWLFQASSLSKMVQKNQNELPGQPRKTYVEWGTTMISWYFISEKSNKGFFPFF